MAYRTTQAEATRKARELLKKMRTTGWNIDVWENIGWYYALRNGHVNLHANEFNGRISYHALISDEMGGTGGLAMWSHDRTIYREPNKAVEGAVKEAKDLVSKLDTAANWMDDKQPVKKSRMGCISEESRANIERMLHKFFQQQPQPMGTLHYLKCSQCGAVEGEPCKESPGPHPVRPFKYQEPVTVRRLTNTQNI